MYSFVRVSSTTSRSLSKERQRRSCFVCHVSSSCSDWLRCGGRSASRAGSRRAARSTTCSTNDPGSQADDGAVEGQRHPSAPGKSVATGFAPRVQMRQYVTMEHLWTARHAARLCREREQQLQPNVPDVEHRSLTMTSIFFAAAFLEALVNEVILDVVNAPAGGPSARVAGIPVDATTTAAFQKLWKKERRIKGGPLGKYQSALDAVSKRRYDEIRDPFKSAQLVFDLRHHFLHFKPETQDIHAEHDFEKALKSQPTTDRRAVVPEQGARRWASAVGLLQFTVRQQLVESDRPSPFVRRFGQSTRPVLAHHDYRRQGGAACRRRRATRCPEATERLP